MRTFSVLENCLGQLLVVERELNPVVALNSADKVGQIDRNHVNEADHGEGLRNSTELPLGVNKSRLKGDQQVFASRSIEEDDIGVVD
jgi:hypothetical protein